MSTWGHGGGASRPGLNARSNHDQVQISIDPRKFDFDEEVEGLRAHVGRIKDLSKAITEERKQQGEIINGLEDAMDRARLALKRSMRRMNVAYQQAQSNHLLYLVLFVIFVFFGVYMLSKIYRLGHHVFGRS